MFIAHLPAGYLFGKAATRLSGLKTKQLVVWTAIGGILPDADLLYFYLVDNQSTHHRYYPSHWPITWLILFVISLLLFRLRPRIALAFAGLSIGSLVHMVLDSVAAPVLWLAPFSNLKIELVQIPAIYENYIWSFVLHWTFAIEIAICSIALGTFLANHARTRQRQT